MKTSSMSFHFAISGALLIGQIFGVLPVNNIKCPSVYKLAFKWSSLRTIYSVLFLIFSSIQVGFDMNFVINGNFSMGMASLILFHVVSLMSSFIMFLMAMKWSVIMQYWRCQEEIFLKHPYSTQGLALKWKVKLATIVVIVPAFVEHILYLLSGFHNNAFQVKFCNYSEDSFFENYLKLNHRPVWLLLPFHWSEVLIVEWINILSVFSWNYLDLFIILISIGLSTRFQQINMRLKKSSKTVLKENFWSEIRVHYFSLCDLVDYMDSQISSLVLVSTGHNMFSLCANIFYSFSTRSPFLLNKLYFWFSLGFLLVRLAMVLYFASSVHDTSISTLSHIQWSKTWSTDHQRMCNSIKWEKAALSGHKLFYITRSLILSMAGSIVSYELFLMDKVEDPVEEIKICEALKH